MVTQKEKQTDQNLENAKGKGFTGLPESVFRARVKKVQEELSAQELDAMAMGLRNSASGKKHDIDIQKYQRNISKLFKERMDKI